MNSSLKPITKHVWSVVKGSKILFFSLLAVSVLIILAAALLPLFLRPVGPIVRPDGVTMQDVLKNYERELGHMASEQHFDPDRKALLEFYLSSGQDSYCFVDIMALMRPTKPYVLGGVFFRALLVFSFLLFPFALLAGPFFYERPLFKGTMKNLWAGTLPRRKMFDGYASLVLSIMAAGEFFFLILFLLFGSNLLEENVLIRSLDGYHGVPWWLYAIWIAFHALIGAILCFFASSFISLAFGRTYAGPISLLFLLLLGVFLTGILFPSGFELQSLGHSPVAYFLPDMNLLLLSFSDLSWQGWLLLLFFLILSFGLYRLSRRSYERKEI